jgi:hypothetical protein
VEEVPFASGCSGLHRWCLPPAFVFVFPAASGRGDVDSQRFYQVRHILPEFGALFVVTSGQQVHMLVEKDTATKLDRLFEINSFDIAISVAYSSNYDIANIMDIYRCVVCRCSGNLV